MFNTSIHNVSSAATIMIGTAFLAVSTLAIATPARAEAPVGFQKAVETSIGQTLRFPKGNSARTGVATVAVVVDANGAVKAATLVGASGTAAFDAEALRTAKTVRYPATGKARTVAMVLGFGQPATAADAARGKVIVEAYRSDSRRLLASDTTAQPAG